MAKYFISLDIVNSRLFNTMKKNQVKKVGYDFKYDQFNSMIT